MTPEPEPTAEQIEIFAEITLTGDDAEELISSPASQEKSDAKWALTLADIASWVSVGSDAGDVKRVGEIEFFEGKSIDYRLDFRNKVRRRYGLTDLLTESNVQMNIQTTTAYF